MVYAVRMCDYYLYVSMQKISGIAMSLKAVGCVLSQTGACVSPCEEGEVKVLCSRSTVFQICTIVIVQK